MTPGWHFDTFCKLLRMKRPCVPARRWYLQEDDLKSTEISHQLSEWMLKPLRWLIHSMVVKHPCQPPENARSASKWSAFKGEFRGPSVRWVGFGECLNAPTNGAYVSCCFSLLGLGRAEFLTKDVMASRRCRRARHPNFDAFPQSRIDSLAGWQLWLEDVGGPYFSGFEEWLKHF